MENNPMYQAQERHRDNVGLNSTNISTRPSVISSLAILKVNWDSGKKDYVENFLPFVIEALRQLDRRELAVDVIRDKIKNIFGLDIPRGPLTTILKRAVRRGYGHFDNHLFIKSNNITVSADFARVRSTVLRKHTYLTTKLIDFVYRRYGIKWTLSQAESTLSDYLERKAFPILASALDGAPFETDTKLQKGSELYILNTFILHLHQADPTGFEYLETIVKGSMLSAVLDLGNIGEIQKRFVKTEIYLDTRIVLNGLGFAGDQLKAPIVELFDMLKECGASLACFEHTYEEIINVLQDVSDCLASNKIQPVNNSILSWCINTRQSASDIQLRIANLDYELDKAGIQIRKKPEVSSCDDVNEAELDSALEAEIKYRNPKARERDVLSLSSVYRLRNNSTKYRLEDCRALFVTTNSGVRNASAKHAENNLACQAGVPVCMLDHELATLAWLKKPQKHQQLARKQIIADCYATMNPPDEVWRKYLHEIERLEARDDLTESDYYRLVYSTEARSLLMEKTLSDPSKIVAQTPIEILNLQYQESTSLTRQLENETDKRKKAEQLAKKYETSAHLTLKHLNNRISLLAKRISTAITNTIISVAIISYLIPTIILIYQNIFKGGYSYFLVLLAIIGIIFIILRELQNETMLKLKNKCQERIYAQTYRFLSWLILGK